MRDATAYRTAKRNTARAWKRFASPTRAEELAGRRAAQVPYVPNSRTFGHPATHAQPQACARRRRQMDRIAERRAILAWRVEHGTRIA